LVACSFGKASRYTVRRVDHKVLRLRQRGCTITHTHTHTHTCTCLHSLQRDKLTLPYVAAMSVLKLVVRNCCAYWETLTSTYTYLLTPWCRVLLEKLTGLQLVKKLPAFHGTRRFITALTSVRHLSLSSAKQTSPFKSAGASVQSTTGS